MKKSIVILAASAVLSSTAGAQAQGPSVFLENLEFQYLYSSMHLPWVHIKHFYKSKTTYENSLGPGWCNRIEIPAKKRLFAVEIETHLVIDAKSVTAIDCGPHKQFGAQSKYVPVDADLARIGSDSIENYIRKGNKITLVSADGLIPKFYLDQDGLALDYEQGQKLSPRKIYGWNGKLKGVDDIKIETDNAGRVTKLMSSDGRDTVTFSYSGSMLSRLSNTTGLSAEFKHKNDVVSSARNAWNNMVNFRYSENYNLNSVELGSREFTVFYDEKRDVVTSIIGMHDCDHKYDALGVGSPIVKVQAQTVCDGKPFETTTMTYHYDGNQRLIEATETVTDKDGTGSKTRKY